MIAASWKLAAFGLLAAGALTAGGVGLAPEADPVKPDAQAQAEVAGMPGEWQLKSVHTDHGQMVYDAAFSPDGKSFVTAGADGTVIGWDTATRTVRWKMQVVKNLPPPGPAAVPAFDPSKPPAAPTAVGANPRPPGSNPPGLKLRYDDDRSLYVWHLGEDGVTTASTVRADGERRDRFSGVDIMPLAFGGGKGVFRADRDHVVRNLPLDVDSSVRLEVPRPDVAGTGFSGWMGWAVSADGKRVALSEWHHDGTSKLRILDAATGKTLALQPFGTGNDSGYTRLAFSPDGKRLACGSNAGRLVVFASNDWREAYRQAEPLTRWVDAVAFTPDGSQLLVTGYREVHEKGWFGMLRSNTIHRELWVRDAATGSLVQSLPLAEPRKVTATANGLGLDVGAMAVAPDGRTAVVTLGSWNRGRPVETPAEQSEKAAAGEVRIYTRGEQRSPPPPKAADEVERNRDLWAWQPRIVPDAAGRIDALAFTPDGRDLLAGGDGKVALWRMYLTPPKTLWRTPLANPGSVVSVAVAPDGRLVAGKPGTVAVLDPALGGDNLFGEVPFEGISPRAVAFSPDGKRVAASDGRKLTVRTVGQPGGLEFGPLVGSTPGPAAVSWAADGKRLVFLPNVQVEGTFIAQVWGAGSGEPMALLPHGPARLTAAVWAADRIFTADEAGEVVVWDGVTFNERKRLTAGGPVRALAVRADGKRIAAGVHVPPRGKGEVRPAPHWNDRVAVSSEWEPDNWLSSSRLELPVGVGVNSLAFSPDGQTLAAGTAAGLALWDRVKLAPK